MISTSVAQKSIVGGGACQASQRIKNLDPIDKSGFARVTIFGASKIKLTWSTSLHFPAGDVDFPRDGLTDYYWWDGLVTNFNLHVVDWGFCGLIAVIAIDDCTHRGEKRKKKQKSARRNSPATCRGLSKHWLYSAPVAQDSSQRHVPGYGCVITAVFRSGLGARISVG